MMLNHIVVCVHDSVQHWCLLSPIGFSGYSRLVQVPPPCFLGPALERIVYWSAAFSGRGERGREPAHSD